MTGPAARKGETLVVTGGRRGIGAAVACLAVARGWDLAVGHARDRAAADAVVGAVSAAGARGLVPAGDVAREEDVVRLFEVGGAGGAIVTVSSIAARLGGAGEGALRRLQGCRGELHGGAGSRGGRGGALAPLARRLVQDGRHPGGGGWAVTRSGRVHGR